MNYDAEFRQDAIDRTPEMFRRLSEALRQYTVSHSAACLEAKDEESSFRIQRRSFPAFFLQIQMQRGAIGYVATERKSASALDNRSTGVIVVICTGQDQFYYRLDGADFASEVQLAEHLLTQVF